MSSMVSPVKILPAHLTNAEMIDRHGTHFSGSVWQRKFLRKTNGISMLNFGPPIVCIKPNWITYPVLYRLNTPAGSDTDNFYIL
jgi:hypothetical protein